MQGRAVKQSPILDEVEKEMRRIGAGNFLWWDSRKLLEILNEDRGRVNALGLTHEIIADRLEDISMMAKQALGDSITIENRYEVRAEEPRGRIPCPWKHSGGLFPKGQIVLNDPRTGEHLVWTDLSIHLIRAHGFYQGKGSPYRLDPETLKRVLNL